jgi:uncharacterized membrane protein YphA (DoxX/SURF4 family)
VLDRLFKPHVDLGCLILRWMIAAIVVVHGVYKVVQTAPLVEQLSPLSRQMTVGWIEIVAGGMLAVGLFSRLAALALIPLQVGAIVLITGKDALRGLSISATGADYTKVGPEFNLAVIAMCLAVILMGSGAVSIDHFLWMASRGKKPQTATQTQPFPVQVG